MAQANPAERSSTVLAPCDRLLIVDDEPAIGALIADAAGDLGYEVHVTNSASAFLEHARRLRPTHIVMDLVLPDASGVELMSSLAADKCGARILLMSGADLRVLGAARRVGLDRGLNVEGALQKPVRLADLRASLELMQSVEHWLTLGAVMGALENDEISLWYQPKIALQTRCLVGLEALARWQHPERGMVLPGEFIPFVESSAALDRVTYHLAGKICRQLAAWNAAGLGTDVALNISYRNLHDARVADVLAADCRGTGLLPERLTLELTETATMNDAVQLIDVVTRLRLKGFRLSIDDFGTGYSSLVQLHRLPFSELKIDRMFVANCAESAESRNIVRVVIDLGHSLNMTVVAEGVESKAALDLLTDLGCDQAQGYYIARPMPASAVMGWAADWADQTVGA